MRGGSSAAPADGAGLCARFAALGPSGLAASDWRVPVPAPSLSEEEDPWRFHLPHRDPHFSRRHLAIQISQDTDQAARRVGEQEHLLRWLRDAGLDLAGRRVLQPLCGPGMTARAILATSPVEAYLGVDFGPAPLRHARRLFRAAGNFAFADADVRSWTPPDGTGFDAILLLYEAANALPKAHLAAMLGRLVGRLRRGGSLVCEVRPCPAAAVPTLRRVVHAPRGALFSPEPHIVLEEAGSLRTGRHMAHQYLIVPLRSGRVEAIHRSTVELGPVEESVALLSGFGLQISAQGRPFAQRASDVPESQQNVVIVARMPS